MSIERLFTSPQKEVVFNIISGPNVEDNILEILEFKLKK